METNERFVKLSSKLPFPHDIRLGQDLTITIEGQSYLATCVKTEEEDQQDGTLNKIYKLKHLT